MKTLIANLDDDVREQLEVGLESFPGLQVENASGFLATERVLNCKFDVVFIGIEGPSGPGHELLERVQESKQEQLTIVVGPETALEGLRKDKVRGKIFGFLKNPLEPVDLFKTVNRALYKDKAI